MICKVFGALSKYIFVFSLSAVSCLALCLGGPVMCQKGKWKLEMGDRQREREKEKSPETERRGGGGVFIMQLGGHETIQNNYDAWMHISP